MDQKSIRARFIGNSNLDPLKPYVTSSAHYILKQHHTKILRAIQFSLLVLWQAACSCGPAGACAGAAQKLSLAASMPASPQYKLNMDNFSHGTQGALAT